MKAMQFDAFGGLASLRQVDLAEPVLRDGEVLVDVAATSINPIDWKLRSGFLRWISPFRFAAVPCFDLAGTIAAAGPNTRRFRVGDRVFGLRPLNGMGAAAARVTAREDQLVAVPPGVTSEHAAGVPLAGMTALQGLLHPAGSGPGRKVLIVGASGGVGHYAVQIAKALDAEVTAVCSTANVEWVRGLGADRVLDYARGETASPAAEFDRVFDAVSLGTFGRWRQWLKPDGRYVTLLPRLDLVCQRAALPLYSRQRAEAIWLKPNTADLSRLAGWMAEGSLQTVVDSVYPLTELSAAFERSRSGRARGKILVRVAE